MKTNLPRWLLLVYCITQAAVNADWTARPLEVHEWGVSEYDWSRGRTTPVDLADFIYTETNPGRVAPKPKVRVKDMDADSGMRIRTKPILYFYGPDSLQKKPPVGGPISVGVEVRFRDGHACAWWPQVNLFRSREQVAKAMAPDLEAWNRARRERDRSAVKSRLKALGLFPDDERFQLVWDRLELSRGLPPGKRLPGENLPDTHWIKVARQVESDYVSIGSEVEKYLFYEGKTQETPAIALVPEDTVWSGRRYLVHNITDHPIYDLFLVYRDTTNQQFWVNYTAQVDPLQKRRSRDDSSGQQSLPHVIYPVVPRFAGPSWKQVTVDETEFHRRTQVRLGNLLRMDYPDPGAVYAENRNPAQSQPPTQEHRLFPMEVAALQKIWNKDFFGHEGLTILYRESPAYLDEAVPLRIYTDMHHYVNLSRCSLVVSRNIVLAKISVIAGDIESVFSQTDAAAPEFDAPAKRTLRTCFAMDRFGTLGLLEVHRRQGRYEKPLAGMLRELKASLN